MREDYAEYTRCSGCKTSLLLCDCNCPKCGKRETCKCDLMSILFALVNLTINQD